MQALYIFYTNILKDFFDKEFHEFVTVEVPKNKQMGDFSSNICMILSKKLAKTPESIANDLLQYMSKCGVFLNASFVKPCFINWFIPKEVIINNIHSILENNYGYINIGINKKINIEYVSANPTGPLHAGHARGAVTGDVLANLLKFVGFDVTKEYYINDAGNQINVLAQSVYFRYLELCGEKNLKIPDEMYPGDYLIPVAKKIFEKYSLSFVNKPEEEWLDIFKKISIEEMMNLIKYDLESLNIKHDIFSSELSLVESGKVNNAINLLSEKGLIYKGILNKPKGKELDVWEEREQLLFKSTAFGDDVDRPLQKSDGTWTYFASDIAYHFDKIKRDFVEIIDFWGADHGGYVKRMKAAVLALSDSKIKLHVNLTQLVKFMKNGEEVKMSKRAGTFITVKDVVEAVGKDVTRFMMLTRRDDAPLDFDFQQVVDQNRENPVFYVQYAYARIHSVLKQFMTTFNLQKMPDFKNVNLNLLDEEDLEFIKVLLDWPRQIFMAAQSKEPHRIAIFLQNVAAEFHSLWNKGKENVSLRFVGDDFDKTLSKIYMLLAIKNVFKIGFEIIGITLTEELR